ncbi:hypothetical protein [Streptomyces sp. NPDC017529]|uniref:hypothetical protein n=1 Tax=Streptomyces sp. NPDC017529 TaxID=3365000 RepID=UPI0037996DEA
MPADRCRPLPICSAGALALAAALSAGAALATAAPAGAAPSATHQEGPRSAPRDPGLRVAGGTADFCLAPGATRALAKAAVRLAAVAPAKLTGTAERRCVTAPISGGAFDTRFTSGHLAFGGGFDFVRKDGRHLKVDALRGDLARRHVTGNVNGSKAHRTDFLAFRIDPSRVSMGGGQVRAQLAFTLTERGAGAFRDAFRARSPLTAGQRVFDGVGTARLAQKPSGTQSGPAPQAAGGTKQPATSGALDPVNDVTVS